MGGFHSFSRPSDLTCRMPPGCTCTIESSPIEATQRVGESVLRPESVTSSTVSPMERIRVALTNETTMYASCKSSRRLRTVHTAFGLPGSSETAISLTARPRCSRRSDERGPRPQQAARYGVPDLCGSTVRASMIGETESMSSTWSKLVSGRGSRSTTVRSPASKCFDEHRGASSSSPTPWNW